MAKSAVIVSTIILEISFHGWHILLNTRYGTTHLILASLSGTVLRQMQSRSSALDARPHACTTAASRGRPNDAAEHTEVLVQRGREALLLGPPGVQEHVYLRDH